MFRYKTLNFINQYFIVLILAFVAISIAVKIFDFNKYNIVFEQSNLVSNKNFENFKQNTLEFPKTDTQISKLFIKFNGNLHAITAYYPSNIKTLFKNKIIENSKKKYSLRTGYYEIEFNKSYNINDLKIQFDGDYYEIGKVILFEKCQKE